MIFSESMGRAAVIVTMYLIDTNVISELRKGQRCDDGVSRWFRTLVRSREPAFLSVITVGELRRGIELSRYRGDVDQARALEAWLDTILQTYQDCILPFTANCAQVWGRLSVPRNGTVLDLQIAATALVYGLTVVTRNEKDFFNTGVACFNPFV